jgi:hypothetical protein
MNDNIIARGEVDILIFEHGKLIGRIQENNLVVTLGKTNIAKLLGGAAAGKAITQIGVGDNGVAPNIADNALSNQFSKAITSVSYPDGQSVLFNFEILNAEANGLTIREFGLLNVDGVLCARKIRNEDIIKTNAIRLVGTWKITIN